jgi:hypothetical protein
MSRKNAWFFISSVIIVIVIIAMFQISTESAPNVANRINDWANKNLMDVASIFINILLMLFLVDQISDSKEALKKTDEELLMQKKILLLEQQAKLLFKYNFKNIFRIDNVGRSAAFDINLSFKFIKTDTENYLKDILVISILSNDHLELSPELLKKTFNIDIFEYKYVEVKARYSDLFSDNNIANFKRITIKNYLPVDIET